MKILLSITLLLLAQIGLGQKVDCSSTEFTVSGKVKADLVIHLSDLDTFQKLTLKDLPITNHTGELKKVVTGLKGVLLKNLLSKLEISAENPKVLSEFYFTFICCDGYKVVYSWNEIFNTETGNNIYLITEKEGVKINDIKESILVVTTADFKTGRRYLKGLTKIIVARAE